MRPEKRKTSKSVYTACVGGPGGCRYSRKDGSRQMECLLVGMWRHGPVAVACGDMTIVRCGASTGVLVAKREQEVSFLNA
jgi:hypothetical protein